MDFLGLRNLTMIDKAVKRIKETRGIGSHSISFPWMTRRPTRLFQTATSPVYSSLETSSGMKQVARDMRLPTWKIFQRLLLFIDQVHSTTGMIDKFIDCKQWQDQDYLSTPLLEGILKDTYGQIVYQEQIMQIAQVLGGYSLGQADLLRRAMGKKKPEEMEKQREFFCAGCAKNSISPKRFPISL
jgi:DNA polymerase-3 subunit alpha